jgi:hypothetical protein
MECEIYNEIAELKAKKSMKEADIVDWFEVYEENNNDA